MADFEVKLEDLLSGAGKAAAEFGERFGPRGQAREDSRATIAFGPAEASGAALVREAARQTLEATSDGSGTAALLAEGMISESGKQLRAAVATPRQLSEGIRKAVAALGEDLRSQAVVVEDLGEAIRLGTSAVGADAELEELLADALAKGGKDGSILVTRGERDGIELTDLGTKLTVGPGAVSADVRAHLGLRALGVTRSLLKGGIVPGGGVALMRARRALDGLDIAKGEEAGVGVVRFALEKPARQIARNAGRDPESFVRIADIGSGWNAFEPFQNAEVDYGKAGIFDSGLVLRTALSSAAKISRNAVLGFDPRNEKVAMSSFSAAREGGTVRAAPAAEPASVDPGAAAPRLPPLLDRYTDVVCPRRVWLGTPRFALLVALTQKPQGPDADRLQLPAGVPVQVSVTVQGLELLDKPDATLIPLAGEDSRTSFLLRPLKPGHCSAMVEYSQDGNPIAAVRVLIEVTEYPVDEGSERYGCPAIDPQDTTPPKLVLCVDYDARPGSLSLQFTLHCDQKTFRFPPLTLRESPDASMSQIYARLEDLREAAIDPVLREVKGDVRILGAEDVDRRVQQLGRILWSRFIPQELKALYGARREEWRDQTLLVLSDEPWIPWELIWPYDDALQSWEDKLPWCMTLGLTRWLRPGADKRQANAGVPPPALRMGQLTLIAPPTATLPAVAAEAGFLASFRKEHEIADGGVSPATRTSVLEALEKPYDWVHAAVHGNFTARAASGSPLWLNEKDYLVTDDLVGVEGERPIRTRRPAFVLNACQVGRNDWTVSGISGWAEFLVTKGAGLVIAPLWSVTDSHAGKFAHALYSAFAAQRSVADAVRAARTEARAEGDPTWLAYSIYAHPNAKVAMGRSAAVPAASAAQAVAT